MPCSAVRRSRNFEVDCGMPRVNTKTKTGFELEMPSSSIGQPSRVLRRHLSNCFRIKISPAEGLEFELILECSFAGSRTTMAVSGISGTWRDVRLNDRLAATDIRQRLYRS